MSFFSIWYDFVARKKNWLFTIGINEYLQDWVTNHQSCFRFVASYMVHFTVFKLRHDFVEVMSTVDTSTPLFVSWLVSQWLAKKTPRQHTMEPNSNCSSQSQWASYELVLATKATVLFWMLSCWAFWEVPKIWYHNWCWSQFWICFLDVWSFQSH